MGKQRVNNLISLAPAPLVKVIGKQYYDLDGTIELCKRFLCASAVDGFELQNLAEWDARTPPRDEREKRFAAWEASQKYTIDELAAVFRRAGVPILSVHANRDVGICLCSGRAKDIERGKQLIHESLALSGKVGAGVCVLHLWDTWKESFDPWFLRDVLGKIASQYPGVRAAVENVPTHLPGQTPFELARAFEWITLDLRWSALFDEFKKFEGVRDRIVNVHLSGELKGHRWALHSSWFPSGQKSFEFDRAVDIVRNKWGYSGRLTVEAYAVPPDTPWKNLVTAIKSLRG